MPRDLFGEVTRQSISIGSRKWYTLPLSLLTHSAIVVCAIAIPVLAAPLMPAILAGDDGEYIVEILPPPPPPVKRLETATPADVRAAPIEAPQGVNDEPSTPTDLPAGIPDGWIGGADNFEGIPQPPPPPVVQQPPPPMPVRVGFGVRAPQKLRDVRPVYPPIAQSVQVQGIVIIEATIGTDGQVTNARILRSVPLLDQAAIDAVSQWEFTPTLLNGVPVPVVMTVTVNFTLK